MNRRFSVLVLLGISLFLLLSAVSAEDIGSNDYESYLAIVPGQFLCDIYKKYGPRLLESNVRSFLNKAFRNP